MRAQIVRSFGGPEVFEPAEMPTPSPGPGEVLIHSVAASVNPVDYKLRAQGPAVAPALPAVLGCDVAGRVAALGPGVDDLIEGDAVFGCVGGVRGLGGTYASHVVADRRLLARVPAALSFRQAAALPLVTITAWEGLDRLGVGRGTRLVVRGGAGGVGHVAIQLAKARGAHVVATVSSPEKAALAHHLGADATVDYRQKSAADIVAAHTDGAGFDAVFDTTGAKDLEGALALARPLGQVATIVAALTADLTDAHAKGLSIHAVFMLLPMLLGRGREAHGHILTATAALADAGQLRPHLDPQRFTLDQVADAHRHLEGGRAVGKVVLDIAPE
ncbi:quinone oxidoreductase [Rhodothalassium salexigens]|uniref:zinc-binding dehydrogenase n=1 Tax=Rhodothalassium salexigens TaxID=1086 RepID=UPI001911878D|nr:zinc-binding dehydrogenase [Rhodothalassium salexigens]MBK5910846.1 quinone oxidoreductase [Rhodothalassium salexigens]MBK5919780.1 quinone oxidoreductase [Rhodothalassium salexigens]